MDREGGERERGGTGSEKNWVVIYTYKQLRLPDTKKLNPQNLWI